MFTPDQHVRKNLADKLGLAYNEEMQDWEYEVSDYNKLPDFIAEYDKLGTTLKEKGALMEIMLDSINSLLEAGDTQKFESYFRKIEERLKLNYKIHVATLYYWENGDFRISERLKEK